MIQKGLLCQKVSQNWTHTSLTGIIFFGFKQNRLEVLRVQTKYVSIYLCMSKKLNSYFSDVSCMASNFLNRYFVNVICICVYFFFKTCPWSEFFLRPRILSNLKMSPNLKYSQLPCSKPI